LTITTTTTPPIAHEHKDYIPKWNKIILSMDGIFKWNNIYFLFSLTATQAPFNGYCHHHHLCHRNTATTNATIIATATIPTAANTATTASTNAATDTGASTAASTAAANFTTTTT
jgi:hypothetical protein